MKRRLFTYKRWIGTHDYQTMRAEVLGFITICDRPYAIVFAEDGKLEDVAIDDLEYFGPVPTRQAVGCI